MIKEARLDRDGFDQRIADGSDPCFAVYTHAQALVSIAAEHLSATKEARQFTRIVSEVEDIYMPSYPPMSPVTSSHFAMWSLFDVQFGQLLCSRKQVFEPAFLQSDVDPDQVCQPLLRRNARFGSAPTMVLAVAVDHRPRIEETDPSPIFSFTTANGALLERDDAFHGYGAIRELGALA